MSKTLHSWGFPIAMLPCLITGGGIESILQWQLLQGGLKAVCQYVSVQCFFQSSRNSGNQPSTVATNSKVHSCGVFIQLHPRWSAHLWPRSENHQHPTIRRREIVQVTPALEPFYGHVPGCFWRRGGVVARTGASCPVQRCDQQGCRCWCLDHKTAEWIR